MIGPLPIAFYAPLKSPNHAAPSGDRTMARLLMKALAVAGFAPELASELRMLDKAGEAVAQETLRERAEAETRRLVAAYRALPAQRRPRLWFTYHVYYKAPDWLGPLVSEALAIPYAVAEGSRAEKRAAGPWALGHLGAEAALDRADAVFVMTAADRPALEDARPARQRLVDMPPFLDETEWTHPPLSPPSPGEETHLLTVAMMRAGDKLASYRFLAEALGELAALPWRLTIIGDGEARGAVEDLFRRFGDRVAFRGQIDERQSLRELYAAADLFVWPAVNEAYGMVLLEAQALGCPVVAGAYGGVASVVRHGRTGLLTKPGDMADFAAVLSRLIQNPPERETLSGEARRFVREERGLAPAARILRAGLEPLLNGTPS